MPQSLDHVLLHLVFSTKDRVPCLGAAVRPALHAYLATIARNAGCECPRAGGMADHVHLAIQLSRTLTIAALVEELKTSSSNRPFHSETWGVAPGWKGRGALPL